MLMGLYLIVTVCDGLLMFFLYFFYAFLGEPFYKATALGFFDRTAISIEPSKLMKIS